MQVLVSSHQPGGDLQRRLWPYHAEIGRLCPLQRRGAVHVSRICEMIFFKQLQLQLLKPSASAPLLFCLPVYSLENAYPSLLYLPAYLVFNWPG